jgi:outer membrane protein assembly factor BamB
MRRRAILAVAASVLMAAVAAAGDWPQWRGPDRDGVAHEKGLLKMWPKAGPELAWKSDQAGLGFSAPAVVGGKVYVLGARDDDEYVIALDAKGKELWATKIGPVFDFPRNNWSRGPNSTPSVDGDHVYAVGSQGELVCVTAAKGAVVWRKNLPKAMKGEVDNSAPGGVEKMGWGFCWSPLVDGDHLVIAPGGPDGVLAKLNKKTGAVVWQSKAAPFPVTYASPMSLKVGGVAHYVQLLQDRVVGIDAENGDLLWTYKPDQPYRDVVCPTPLVKDGKVYVTVGYGGGCDLLEPEGKGKKFTVKAAYSERAIANKQGGVVALGDHVYGAHEDRGWACQELATGKVLWESKRNAVPVGELAAADGMLYLLTEKDGKGLVALVDASPTKYAEKGRFSLPEASEKRKPGGHVWTHPVIADGKLYLRDQEWLFCYKIK